MYAWCTNKLLIKCIFIPLHLFWVNKSTQEIPFCSKCLLQVFRYCLSLIVMSPHWVSCCNDGGASWKSTDNSSFGQTYALLLHSFQQGLVLIPHLIKFINTADTWRHKTELSCSLCTWCANIHMCQRLFMYLDLLTLKLQLLVHSLQSHCPWTERQSGLRWWWCFRKRRYHVGRRCILPINTIKTKKKSLIVWSTYDNYNAS